MTKTRIVANFVNAKSARGIMVFNDKLSDGTRSLKVWGWKQEDYFMAISLLTQLGCQVRPVVTRRGRTRLYVTE